MGHLEVLADGSIYLNNILLNQHKMKKGYLVVSIGGKMVSSHRLVAKYHLSSWDPDLQVNHINGDKTDNRVENLEMVTNQQNRDHAIANGLVNNRGSKNGMSKLTESDVREIKKLLNTETQTEIAKMFGVDCSTVSNIKTGTLWRYI